MSLETPIYKSVQRQSEIFLASLLLTSGAFAQQLTPPNAQIRNFQVNGSGCETGTANAFLSEDNEAVTVTFSDFIAESVDGQPAVDRKACRVSFQMSAPNRWQVGVIGVEQRGAVFADEGSIASTDFRFRRPNGQFRTFETLNFEGYTDDFYIRSETVPVARAQWFGCQNPRRILMDFAIEARSVPGSESFIAVDSIDAEIEEANVGELKLLWRPCRGDGRTRFTRSCTITVEKTEASNGIPRNPREFALSAQGFSPRAVNDRLRAKFRARCAQLRERRGIRCRDLDISRSCSRVERF